MDTHSTVPGCCISKAMVEMAAKTPKTYNTRDSLVVTDPTTDRALTSLTRGERTGSRILL